VNATNDARATVDAWTSAMHGGDFAAARSLLAADVVFRFDADPPLGGARTGPDGVFEFFGQLAAVAGTPTRGAMLDLLASDRHALELYEREVEVDGEPKSARIAVLYEVRARLIAAIDYLPVDRGAFESMLR
jgi:ketosteroid isomerase-like protein